MGAPHRRRKATSTRETWMRVVDPERIILARRQKKFTQRDLALLTGCSQAAISGLETGTMPTCSQALARAIAHRLDVDVDDLFATRDRSRVARVTNAAGTTRRKAAA